jgi:hypothetical protein
MELITRRFPNILSGGALRPNTRERGIFEGPRIIRYTGGVLDVRETVEDIDKLIEEVQ